jgi:hypothetical protein
MMQFLATLQFKRSKLMVGQIALTCKYFGVNIFGYFRDELAKLGHKLGCLGETNVKEIERGHVFEL